MSTLSLAPGVHLGLTNEQYHTEVEGTSKSQLDVMERSELHYWQAYVNPDRPARETTDAFTVGSAIHSAVLEPDVFPLEFICEPVFAPKRPSKAQLNAKKPSPESKYAMEWWSDFNMLHGDQVILTQDQYATAIGCRDAVLKHPLARSLVNPKYGRAETSYLGIDPETGARIKARTDWENQHEGMIVDLKSTVDSSPRKFMQSVLSYRYFVQQPWYMDTIDAACDGNPFERWSFLAIEKDPPYAIGIYTLPKDVVSAGRRAAAENHRAILRCRASGVWRDYAEAIIELPTPGWMQERLGMNSAEADFGGLDD